MTWVVTERVSDGCCLLQVHHLTVMGVPAACVGGSMPWEEQQKIYDNIYHDPNSVKVR